MLLALVLAATEGAAEHSKTAFYFAGGALAAWAVLLGVAGLTRAELPSNQAGERGIIGITGLLVAATLVSAVATAG
jgi:hypothetical protein